MPTDQRKQLTRPREVKVSAAEIQRMLAEIPDLGSVKKKAFSAEQDALILAGWKKKSQIGMARYLGCAVGTLRRRYLELTEGV